MKKTKLFIIISLISSTFFGCRKEDLLNAKPSSNIQTASTLQDFQAMLDNNTTGSGMNVTPPMGDGSSDSYYMTSSFLLGRPVQVQAMYSWQPDIYQGQGAIMDWSIPYQQILYTNIIFEGLNEINVTPSTQSNWEFLKGQAHFFRAYAFFNVAQLYAPFYDSAAANSLMGIPLRLSSDPNVKTTRSTLKETYDQIFIDLNSARSLLKNVAPITNKNRPSLTATYALFARIYLSMGDYTKAGKYADSSLQQYSTLIDFNLTKTSTSWYLPYNTANNAEVIFNSNQGQTGSSPGGYIQSYITGSSNLISVDTTLYRSYNLNDLRRSTFYYVYPNGAINLNGGYGGFATNEMYFIRAECYARAGNTNLAMQDLNTVLQKRWKTGTFISYSAANSASALSQILTERRKELPFLGVRWTDLRRLNKEGYNIVLSRNINGQIYTLQPNDPKYVMPIPPDVLQLSGITQNQR